MNRNTKKYNQLLKRGYDVPEKSKQFKFPIKQNTFTNDKLLYHQASQIQRVYSPFQQNYYNPPHLNSSQSTQLLHKGQSCKWQIRKSFNSKNYQNQYAYYQKKVQQLKKRKYKVVSKIKYLLDQDKTYKLNNLPQSDYSEDSQI